MVRTSEYLTATGVPLRSIPGGRTEADEWDEPISYVPTDLDDVDGDALGWRAGLEEPSRLAELRRDLARADETCKVWQETAQALNERVERMVADLARLTGRSQAAVRAHYYAPPTQSTGGAIEPI